MRRYLLAVALFSTPAVVVAACGDSSNGRRNGADGGAGTGDAGRSSDDATADGSTAPGDPDGGPIIFPGEAGPSETVTLTLDTQTLGSPILSTSVGANLLALSGATADVSLLADVARLGVRVVRWPGGSYSDLYHWETNAGCDPAGAMPAGGLTPARDPDTFDQFMGKMRSAGLDVVITVNYGTNATCDGGGDPAEAARWVAHAKDAGDEIRYWTVGNESYRVGEVDDHASKNDASTYAAAVGDGGEGDGYYALMKKQDPDAQVGVLLFPNQYSRWDSIVLHQAAYDFVEIHDYPEYNAPPDEAGADSDEQLLGIDLAKTAANVALIRAELADAGKPSTPIMVGEFNAEGKTPTHQSVSIVNALFTSVAVGEYLKAGISIFTFYEGMGGAANADPDGAASDDIYGWQDFGTYNLLSDPDIEHSYQIEAGTPLPPGVALNLVSLFARTDEHMLNVTVGGAGDAGGGTLRAYAATQGGGYAVMLVNLDGASAVTAVMTLPGAAGTSWTATTLTYDKAQYDRSKPSNEGLWAGPLSAGPLTGQATVTLTLPPWSQTVLFLK